MQGHLLFVFSAFRTRDSLDLVSGQAQSREPLVAFAERWVRAASQPK